MKFIRSFGFAWQGIQYCFKTQFNFRFQLTAFLMVIAGGLILEISTTEWLLLITCSILVLVLELINTAIELLCDVVTKEIHPVIKIIKDVSAAAVLLGAAGSVVTGTIIFLPKIIERLKL